MSQEDHIKVQFTARSKSRSPSKALESMRGSKGFRESGFGQQSLASTKIGTTAMKGDYDYLRKSQNPGLKSSMFGSIASPEASMPLRTPSKFQVSEKENPHYQALRSRSPSEEKRKTVRFEAENEFNLRNQSLYQGSKSFG